jgi:FkbM family methyltransferase
MRVYYGISSNYIDVTDACLSSLTKNNVITIPFGDINRARYFSDPIIGTRKRVFVSITEGLFEYDDNNIVKIDLIDNKITVINENLINSELNNIHSKLTINHGSLLHELVEQQMSVMYLNGDEKILEIGGNIGRNSLVIASILDDDTNFVSLECDDDSANKLQENRDINNFHFHIENSALSNRKLIQLAWDTKPSEVLEDGYNWVKTITLNELKNKYNIEFDTLILDCEGAFYYILMDMPEILDNINLILMENDYYDINHKNYIDNVLRENNFYVEYSKQGGWGPCSSNFYEAWRKHKL